MVVRIYYIPQSAPIRVRGSSPSPPTNIKRLPINRVVERVTDAQRLRILQVFRQGFLGLFEMNKSWLMGVWWNVDTPDLESGTSNGVRVRVSPSPLTLLYEQMSWLVTIP